MSEVPHEPDPGFQSDPSGEAAVDSWTDLALPKNLVCWILSDGKIGDEVQCLGIAEALGLVAQIRHIAPRPAYAWAMPYGPIDPRDRAHRPESPLAPPFPNIAIAAGRRTVPYLRTLKRLSRGATFTVFVKDPYWSRGSINLIVAPEHDELAGKNVFATITPANRLHAWRLSAAWMTPDPQIAQLTHPRVALILGGNSQHHHFESKDFRAIQEIALQLIQQGMALMVTPSRRTPPELTTALAQAIARLPADLRKNVLFWRGKGRNPYVSILAHADAIIVTADSVNMVGEAVATGAPVHVYEPSGGHLKITAYLARLEALGAVRPWRGELEDWRYPPLNATPLIAQEIARRYAEFQTRIPSPR
jgi:uncharacterized protein